jgi:hypothetical protein
MSIISRAPKLPLAVATCGTALCVLGVFVDPARLAAAYLVAYVSSLAVVLGTLAMIMIARVTGATWFVVLRRQAEEIVATLPLFVVLFLPILVAVHVLYPWAAHVSSLDPVLRRAILAKGTYLNVPFFVVRSFLYLAMWVLLGESLRRASLAQDGGDSVAIERRMRTLSAVGLVVFALTITFAAFDWMMSLTPAWYSTIYGVDYFAGAMVSALSLLAVIVALARRRGELPAAVGAEQFHALAKLLLTFLLFWVYIGFSQLIVIWSAEIPGERVWYAVRMRGGWNVLGAVIVAGHFAIPFCALLVRAIKRSSFAMSCLGVWLLMMHYLDSYWTVMPDTPHGRNWGGGYWLDLGALLLVTGVACTVWAVRRADKPPIPVGDPALAASLVYSATSA